MLGENDFNRFVKSAIQTPKHSKNFSDLYSELRLEFDRIEQRKAEDQKRQQQAEFHRALKAKAIQDALNKKTKFLASLTKEQKTLYKATHKGE